MMLEHVMIFRVQYTGVGVHGLRIRAAHEHARAVGVFGRENVIAPRLSTEAKVARKCQGNRYGGGMYATRFHAQSMGITQIGGSSALVPKRVEMERNIVVEVALILRLLTAGEIA